MIVSGVPNPTIYPQDYTLLSFYLKDYTIISTEQAIAGDILVETNPEQVLRKKMMKNFALTAYLSFEMPKKAPYSNIFLLDPKLINVTGPKIKLLGNKKCYLSRADDLPYFKDGDLFLYGNNMLVPELQAYYKRWGHKVTVYVDFPFEEVEQCGTLIPTNPYAESILRAGGLAKGLITLDTVMKSIEKELTYFSTI